MSWRFAQLALAAFVGFASPVIAADRDWDACKQSVQDWDKEIAGCSAVLSRSRITNGDRAFALNNRGFAYDVKGDHDRAIADYNEAIRLKPDDAAVFNNRGFVYDKMGDHDRAIADYNEAIRLKPDLANAFNNRGATYEAKGDHDRAIADYAQAVHLKPDYAIAFKNRGLAYNAKGDRDLAIADFNEAIRLKPDYAVAYNDRGRVYEAKGDHDRAIADYNEAIRLRPEYADAFHNRGVAYDHTGDHDRAISDYNEAIRLQPDYAFAFGDRGFTCAQKGEHDRAITDYNEAVRLKPDYGTAFNNRGYEYYLRGEYDRAIADYDEAIRFDSNGASQFNNRGLAYAVKGDYDRAIADCTESIRLNSKMANPHRHRGFAYFRKGDLDRALSDLEDAIRLNPKYALAYATRGMVFEKKGELPRAQADFNQAPSLERSFRGDRRPGPGSGRYCGERGRRHARRIAASASRPRAGRALADRDGDPRRRRDANNPSGRPCADGDADPVAVASPSAQAPSLPVALTAIPISRRVALIVANHAYPVAPLANPPVDAEMIKASLEKVGFSVVVKNDLDLDAFEQAITDFAETSRGADVALFYFAGHGFSIVAGGRQQNLLMSTSANFSAKTAIALEGGGEPLEHVEETIIGHARATLIFIDACRNVPVLASRGVGSRGFAPIDSSNFEGAYVVLSTRQGKTAEDGPGGQGSPFARAFASVLPTPGLRIEDAYARIREKVRADTHGEQVPDTIRSDLPEGGVVLMAGAGP